MSLLIVAYLFLGGAGAGAFAVLACIDVRHGNAGALGFGSKPSAGASALLERRRFALLTKRGYAAACAVLLLGTVCLLADLGRPEAAYLLFARPNLTYISVGAYALAVLTLCALCIAVLDQFAVPGGLRRARPFALLLGFAASLFVMAYTGLFLQSMSAVALWQSPFLVVLFALSALSTGIALVVACASGLGLERGGGGIMRRLAKADLAIIILEFAACAACLVAVSELELGRQSVERLVAGDWSAAFMMGFVLCGLVVPGVLDGVAALKDGGETMDMAMACLVLIGGFCLRMSMVGAGIHSSV